MQDIEINHRVIRKFEQEFKQFRDQFNSVSKLIESLRDMPKIVERTVPMVTHFQICEGF